MNIDLLIKKAIKGDNSDSFISLIETNQAKIYRIAYSYVKNQQDALDIVQETVYKAFVSIKTLKNPKYFNTWLIRIAINSALDHVKKSKKCVSLEDTLKDTKNTTNQIEENIDLYTALDKLDSKHKTVVILKYFEDLTFKEISNILDYPTSTVKTYFYRALKHLKISIEEGYFHE